MSTAESKQPALDPQPPAPTQTATQAAQQPLREELAALARAVSPSGFVDTLFERAFQHSATDIHVDPQPGGLLVRLRIDGILHDILTLTDDLAMHVRARIKLLGGMDITEKRLAQDGHIHLPRGGKNRGIRVATVPTQLGEKIALRLLPEPELLRDLDSLGLDAHQIDLVRHAISAPYGMLLTTGPVGSGKTTSLYTYLRILNSPTKNVMTIEDPVEYNLPRLNQIQVDPRRDFTFVAGLRAILRQDPNIVMVGEIRDEETARIAIRAALTGTFVLSSLHARNSTAAVGLLRDFGISHVFVADALVAIVSQRLVRTICPGCRAPYAPRESSGQALGLAKPPDQLYRGEGCARCFQTGYLGRTGVYEVLIVDDVIRRMILDRQAPDEIRQTAVTRGLRTLEDSVQKKVLDGVTTLEEMYRVLLAHPADRIPD